MFALREEPKAQGQRGRVAGWRWLGRGLPRPRSQQTEDDGLAYDGFISYSHAVDGGLAPALQHGLQRFAKPWYSLRALRIFRDDAALSANPHLWTSIEKALDGSRYYILLASPEAASSRWVAREAARWRECKSVETLLIALTDGRVAWDDEKQDFDAQTTDAIPPCLYGAFEGEPRYIDLRWARQSEHLSLTHPRFRDAVAELAAPLHNRSKDDIAGQEVREHRRTIRIVRGGVAALAVLTVFAVASAVTAFIQRGHAIDQERLATSRELAAQSLLHEKTDPQLALLLALEAVKLRRSPDALAALRAILPSERQLRSLPTGEDSSGLASANWSPDGRLIVTAGGDGAARLWNAQNGQLVTILPGHRRPVDGALFDRSGAEVLTWAQDGTTRLFHLQGNKRPSVTRDPDGKQITDASLSPDGRLLATAHYNRAPPRLWDAATGKLLRDLGRPRPTTDIEFSPDGRLVATGDQDGFARIWRVSDGRALHVLSATGPERQQNKGALFGVARFVWSVRFSPDGTRLLTGNGDGTARIFDVSSGRRLDTLAGDGRDVSLAIWSPDGQRVALASEGGTARVWDLNNRQNLRLSFTARVNDVSFNRDGSLLVASSADGAVRVVDVHTGSSVASLVGHIGEVGSASFSPTDSKVLTAASDATARIWDISEPRPTVAPPLRADELVGDVSMFLSPRPLASRLALRSSLTDDVKIVDARSRKPLTWLRLPRGTSVDSIDFDRAGRVMLVLASIEGRHGHLAPAQLRLPVSGAVLHTLSGPGSRASAGALSPDGKLAVAADPSGRIGVWDVGSGRRVSSFGGHYLRNVKQGDSTEQVVALVFSRDGRLILSEDLRGRAFVWRARTGRVLNVIRGAAAPRSYSLASPGAISSDDRLAAVVWHWDPDVHVYAVGVRKEQAVFKAPTDGLSDAAFNDDASVLGTVGFNGIDVWDIRQQQVLQSLKQPGDFSAGDLQRVAFTHAGDILTDGGRPTVPPIWDPSPKVIPYRIYPCVVCGGIDRLLALARQRETRQLTTAERRRYLSH